MTFVMVEFVDYREHAGAVWVNPRAVEAISPYTGMASGVCTRISLSGGSEVVVRGTTHKVIALLAEGLDSE